MDIILLIVSYMVYTSFYVSDSVWGPRACGPIAWQWGKREMSIVTRKRRPLPSIYGCGSACNESCHAGFMRGTRNNTGVRRAEAIVCDGDQGRNYKHEWSQHEDDNIFRV